MDITPDSPSVIKTIEVHQATIERMAKASATCKNWCVTVVTGILAISIDKDLWWLPSLAVLPLILFAILDMYYLAIEWIVRDSYKTFTEMLSSNQITKQDLFKIATRPPDRADALRAIGSGSILPFYFITSLTTIIVLTVMYFK